MTVPPHLRPGLFMRPARDAMVSPHTNRRASRPAYLTALALTCGCGSCGDSEATTVTRTEPPKVVVQASDSGSMDAESMVGLVAEVTHWLQYSPGIVVRHPRPGLLGSEHGPGAASDDADHVLWISASEDETGVSVLWDLVGATGSDSPALEDASPIRGALPKIPPSVAAAVLRELAVDRAGRPPPGTGGACLALGGAFVLERSGEVRCVL